MTMRLRQLMLANRGRGSFRAEAATIWLYDTIASDETEAEWWGGVSPAAFISALRAIDGPVTLRINSPGGSVFGAQAMVAEMRAFPHPITAQVDALAASAASVIAAEAARTVIHAGARIMIHNAWTIGIGNKESLRQTADLLESIDADIAAAYARRSGRDPADYAAMMAAETWLNADAAVAAGLADAVVTESLQRDPAQDRITWDLSALGVKPPAAKLPGPEIVATEPPAVPGQGPDAGATPEDDRGRSRRVNLARALQALQPTIQARRAG